MITHNQHRYNPPARYTDRHAGTLQLKHSACTPPSLTHSLLLPWPTGGPGVFWHQQESRPWQAAPTVGDGEVRGPLGSPPRNLSRQHLLFPPRGPRTQHLDHLAQMPGSWAGFAGLGLWPTHQLQEHRAHQDWGRGWGGEQELSQSSYPLWVLRAAGGKEPSVAQKNSSVAVSRLRPGCTLLFPFSFSLLSSLLPSANTSLSWVTSPDSLTSCFVETQLLGALLD